MASDNYTPEFAAAVCDRLACGESLLSISRDEGMPNYKTIFNWMRKYPDFAEQYRDARETQAHYHAEMAVQEALVARDPALGRLAYDARKWFAGRMAPKTFGDKLVQEHTGADGGPIQINTERRSFVDEMLLRNAGPIVPTE